MSCAAAVYLDEGGADDGAGIDHGVVWFICRREDDIVDVTVVFRTYMPKKGSGPHRL